MDGLKITIHPLFFIFGLYFALTGKVFSFIAFTLTAGIHEYGHYVQSIKLGYKLNKITLMPYGAIISGDLDGLLYKDECKIALAGPFINGVIALCFIAVWWFAPSLYAYTELIVMANASICFINLLPAYPLDGGRFLYATLCLFLARKTAIRIVKFMGFLLATGLLALFIYSCFVGVNFTILFFSLFMYVGVFVNSEGNRYVKIYSSFSISLKKPTLIKRYAVPSSAFVKDLYAIVGGDYFYEITIYNNNKKIAVLSGEKLLNLLTNSSAYITLLEALNDKAE